jgi:hypothetical protein
MGPAGAGTGAGHGRRWQWAVWAVALVVEATALGCTPRDRTDPTANDALASICPPARAADGLPVITTLVTRDHEVTVLASDDGLRFTVALADGALLGHQLTPIEFAGRFPALQQRLHAAFAGDEPWLDASLAGSAPGQ